MSEPANLNWNSKRNVPGPETVKAALRDAVERVDAENYNKAIIILLDDSIGCEAGWSNAGMKMSECIALMEFVKHRIIKELMLE